MLGRGMGIVNFDGASVNAEGARYTYGASCSPKVGRGSGNMRGCSGGEANAVERGDMGGLALDTLVVELGVHDRGSG